MIPASFLELLWSLAPFAGFAAGYAAARIEIAHRRRKRRFRVAVSRPIDADTIDAAVRGDI
jgi:hypothetical protein